MQDFNDFFLPIRLYKDLTQARPCLAINTSLHLLYLVTPYDFDPFFKFTASQFQYIYLRMKEPELNVASILGVNEQVAVGLMRGRQETEKTTLVLDRLYRALVLFNVWNGKAINVVADMFQVGVVCSSCEVSYTLPAVLNFMWYLISKFRRTFKNGILYLGCTKGLPSS